MFLIRKNSFYFFVIFISALVSSYFVISNWIFKSDFLTYQELATFLAKQQFIDILSSNFLSIRVTEPIFILFYWILSERSYILLPLVNLILYNFFLLRYTAVSWLALFALLLLQLTPTFQAFHLQRQFMSVIFLMVSLYFSKGYRRYIFWVLAILTHNSAILLFPLYLRSNIALFLFIPIVYLLHNLSTAGFHVGGDYELGSIYYIILAFFSLSIFVKKRITANLDRDKVTVMLVILWYLIFFLPYLGSRLYFTVFFVILVPGYFYRKIY